VSRTRIVILRHPAERTKTGNTGRFASLALPNSELIEYGAPHRALSPGAWLLYPGEAPQPEGAPTELVVLDGSWSQARHMFQRSPTLWQLPRLSLGTPSAPRVNRLRRAPSPDRVSTLEAIARALELLEGHGNAAPLDALYDEVVRRSVPPRAPRR
jgi:DTW domain-containing protein YfiP